MSNYTITTDFASKDNLISGNPLKLIKGADFTTEFTNIATAVTSKQDATVRTPSEITAGVTPTNLNYPEGHLLRYGADSTGVTNSYTPFASAVAVCKLTGNTLTVPVGNFKIDTASGTLNLSYVTILGTGVSAGTATPAAAGSVLSIVGTANSPFTIGPGVTFDGIAFFYPAQVDTATPIVFPPTMITSLAIAGAINFVYIQNCTVFNAYRFFVDTDSTGAIGHVWFLNNTIYGILTCFEFAHNAEIITIEGNEFTFGHYLAATEGGLRGYTRANGTVLKVIRTDGITFQGNVCFGYLNGIFFATSATICQLTAIVDNYFDQCLLPIIATGTGNLSNVTISGNVINAFNSQNTALIGNCVKLTTTGALALEAVAISSNILSTCTGDAILVTGNAASRSISVTGNQIDGIGAFQTTGSYACLNITGSATSYIAQGNYCVSQTGTPAVANGILGSVSGAVITGNIFGSYQTAINATFNNVLASGNWSYGTLAAAANNYGASTTIVDVGNNWDKASGSITRTQMTVRKNAAQTFATGATSVVCTFPTSSYDKGSNWTAGTSTFTAKQAARYRFTWALMHDNTATAGERWGFTLTPSVGAGSTLSYTTIANYNSFTASIELDLPNAATVQLLVSQFSGTHNLVTFNDANSNYLSVSIVE